MNMNKSIVSHEIVNRDRCCNNCGCVIVYFGKHCFFCDIAEQKLLEILQTFGLSSKTITKIDVDAGCDCDCEKQVTALPAIRICNELIVGLPETEDLRSRVVQMLMNECFHED